MRYKTEGMSTHVVLKPSASIITLDEVSDGVIKIAPSTRGKIVGLHNQVSADIWFSEIGKYGNDPVREALNLGGTYAEHLRGVVLHTQRAKFAVVYSYKEHENIRIREDKALAIPYFTPDDDSMKQPSCWYVGNERGVEYQLGYIKDVCDEVFANFVSTELKFKKITKSEREDRNYPSWADRRLTDKSEVIYTEERQKLEMAFARVSGVYAEFLGGLVFD
jgi:hypothetical protein